jgi:hypothetical protein
MPLEIESEANLSGLDANSVFELYGSLIEPGQIAYPRSPQEEETLLTRIATHSEQGGHVAIVDGAYDVPHDGHTWYLRRCRMAAAANHFGEEFLRADRAGKLDMVASDVTMLIVTLDADHKVASKKGNNPDKGNVERPVYTWDARANRIGGLMVPDSSSGYRPAVDIVTVEGDPIHEGGALESHLTFGSRLYDLGVLGTWLVYGEHNKVSEQAADIAGEGIVEVISEDSIRVIDPRTDRNWSSSDLIERIKRG